MNAIVVIDTLTPEVFAKPGGIDALLSNLETKVRAVKTDISTKSGREAVASLAYQVVRSRTALDEMGKKLGETHYKSWKAICSERARIETRLDALRDEVRKPLDDYEAAESTRVAGHQGAIQAIIDLGTFSTETPGAGTIIDRLISLDARSERYWEEFEREAEVARLQTFAKLTALKEAALTREAEAAELERLRIEKAARDRQEREDLIASAAAERARLEAEAKAAGEIERAERERLAAVAKTEQAERETALAASRAETARIETAARVDRERVAASAQAETDRVMAIENERQRVANEEAAAQAETQRREADREHRKAINTEILSTLVALGLTVKQAMDVIVAIATRKVPHVRVDY